MQNEKRRLNRPSGAMQRRVEWMRPDSDRNHRREERRWTGRY